MNLNLTLFAQAIVFAAFIWFTAKFVWPLHAARHRDAPEDHRRRPRGRRAGAPLARDLDAAGRGRGQRRRAAGRAEILAQAEKRAAQLIDEARMAAREEGDREIAAAQAPRSSRK